MDRRDEKAADIAMAALARSAGVNEACELFFRHGDREFRHEANFVTDNLRTLRRIGWQHADEDGPGRHPGRHASTPQG